MLQIEQKLLRAFGRVPQHEIGALVHWDSPLSLSISLFYKGKSWAWHPEGVSTHALKQQTVVVGLEVGGRGELRVRFNYPSSFLDTHRGTEQNAICLIEVFSMLNN